MDQVNKVVNDFSRLMKERQYGDDDEISRSRQFDLQSSTLITGEGTEVDLSNLVVQIEFYEDINANCVAGYITIQDTVGLVNSANHWSRILTDIDHYTIID